MTFQSGHIYNIRFREGDQKRPFCSLLLREGGGEGGGGNVKDYKAFFISHAFVGVLQNDPGPLKPVLELRDYVKYTFSFFISFFTMV